MASEVSLQTDMLYYETVGAPSLSGGVSLSGSFVSPLCEPAIFHHHRKCSLSQDRISCFGQVRQLHNHG